MATIFTSQAYRKVPTRRSEPADHTVMSEPESFLLDAVNEAIKFQQLPLPVTRVKDVRLIIADADTGTAALIDVIITNDPLVADTAGTTTYTLISQSTVGQAGGSVSAAVNGANFSTWYMKAIRGTPSAPYFLAVRVQTAPGTPKVAAFNVQCGMTYQNDVKD